MRESAIRMYLRRRVQELGGEIRAMKWLGRDHAPDDFVMLPERHLFVESKRPGETARAGQVREHERMRAAGCEVLVLDTIEKIDLALPPPTNHERKP